MTQHLQEAAQHIQERDRAAKSQPSQAGSRASDKYPRKSAHASTPTKTTRPPVLVVSPQSDIRKVEVSTGRRQSRSPRATRHRSRSPRRSPRRRSPRRSSARSYGEHRRNRSPNCRRRDVTETTDPEGAGKVAELHRLMTTRHDRLTHQLIRGRHSHSAGDIILRREVTPPLMFSTENSRVLTPNAYKGKKVHNQKWPSPNVRPRRSLVTKSASPSFGRRSKRKLWLNSMARKLSVRHTMDLMRTPIHISMRYQYQKEGRLWSIPLTSLPFSQSISPFLCTSPRPLPLKQLRLRKYLHRAFCPHSCHPVP